MFSKKLKKLMDEKGISNYQLEKELGLGNGAISKWDKSTPRLQTVVALADFFEVPIGYFLE